jgi:hypothetical protein
VYKQLVCFNLSMSDAVAAFRSLQLLNSDRMWCTRGGIEKQWKKSAQGSETQRAKLQ